MNKNFIFSTFKRLVEVVYLLEIESEPEIIKRE